MADNLARKVEFNPNEQEIQRRDNVKFSIITTLLGPALKSPCLYWEQ